MERIRTTYGTIPLIKSDKKTAYGPLVKYYLLGTEHRTYKGRRASVVGQGEMKKGGFDPIFMLNHSYAMFRDNLKTLSRKTWCTSKKLCRLQDLFDLYTHYHNRFAVLKERAPRITGDPIIGAS